MKAPEPASPCTPLSVWATLVWGMVALGAWVGTQVGLAAAALRWFGVNDGDLAGNALVVAIVTIGAVPPALAVIALAARSTRCGIAQYLALRWPARGDLLLGLLCLAVLIPSVDVVSMLAGRDVAPSFVTNLYRNARDAGTLPLMVLSLAVAAPVVEESLFRGLLLPGLAASRLGPAGAVALIAAGWTLMHLQYEPFYLMQALTLGILFGWMRWRTGSTLLAMMLHGIVNLTSVIQAGIIVEWMS